MVKDIKEHKALIMMNSTRKSDVRGNRITFGRSRRCSLLRYQLENISKRLGLERKDAIEVVDRVVPRDIGKRALSENVDNEEDNEGREKSK